MNKRFQELHNQARDFYLQDEYLDVSTKELHRLVEQKLAELIVRECMNIAKNWQDQLENANCFSESNAVGIVAYRIARQFGVKE